MRYLHSLSARYKFFTRLKVERILLYLYIDKCTALGSGHIFSHRSLLFYNKTAAWFIIFLIHLHYNCFCRLSLCQTMCKLLNSIFIIIRSAFSLFLFLYLDHGYRLMETFIVFNGILSILLSSLSNITFLLILLYHFSAQCYHLFPLNVTSM